MLDERLADQMNAEKLDGINDRPRIHAGFDDNSKLKRTGNKQ